MAGLAIVSVEYKVADLLARIKKRGRDYELAYYTAEYLSQLNAGLAALKTKLSKSRVPIFTVDETMIGDYVADRQEANKLQTMVGAWWKKLAHV